MYIIITIMSRMVEETGENPQVWPQDNTLFFVCFVFSQLTTPFFMSCQIPSFWRCYNFSEPDAALQHWHEAFVNVSDKHAVFKTYE